MVLFACSRQGEDVNVARDLRCRLIDIIVSIASSTSEGAEPAHQELTPGVSSLGSEPLEKVTSVPPPTPEPLLEPAPAVTPATEPLLEPATGLFLEPVTPAPPPASEPLLEPATPVPPPPS